MPPRNLATEKSCHREILPTLGDGETMVACAIVEQVLIVETDRLSVPQKTVVWVSELDGRERNQKERGAQVFDSDAPAKAIAIRQNDYSAQQVTQQSGAQAQSPPVSQAQPFASQTQTSQVHASPQHEQGAD